MQRQLLEDWRRIGWPALVPEEIDGVAIGLCQAIGCCRDTIVGGYFASLTLTPNVRFGSKADLQASASFGVSFNPTPRPRFFWITSSTTPTPASTSTAGSQPAIMGLM